MLFLFDESLEFVDHLSELGVVSIEESILFAHHFNNRFSTRPDIFDLKPMDLLRVDFEHEK